MKHIKKFNETKKDEKVKDQEVLFNAEVLADKDEKPSFKTEVEDQEKVKKEFDKLNKVKKFEAFIDVDIHIDNIDEVEIENDYNTEEFEEESEESGCESCGCQDCACGGESEEGEEVEQTNTESGVRVMNISDFLNSITNQ